MQPHDTDRSQSALTLDPPARTGDGTAFRFNDDLLARVVRTSPFGIVLSTLDDGQILDVNEGFTRLTGYSRDEAVGTSSLALGLWVDPVRRTEIVSLLRKQRRLQDVEVLMRTRSGDERHFIAAMEAVEVDGVECAITQFSDLTPQRQAEEARIASEAQFQTLVEQIPAVVYTESLGDSGTYTYVSPQAEAIFGYTPAEIVAHPGATTERIHPDDRQRVLTEGERTTATGEPFCLEYRVQARDGRWVRVRDEAVLVRDDAGRPLHWQGLLIDVTRHRRAEEALRESESRFRATVASAPIGILMYDAAGTVVLANSEAERLLGVPEGQLLGQSPLHQRWRAVREDGSPFAANDHPAMVALRTGKPCEGVIMGVPGHGDVVTWLSVNSRPLLHDGESTPYAGISTFVDLTRRRFLETELRRNEERFRALVQNSHDVVTVIRPDGSRAYVSPSIERELGFTAAELVDGAALDLVHPDDVPLMRDAIACCLEGAARTPVLEVRFRHRNDEWRWFETIGTNLLEEPGVNGIVFNSRSITARKQVEAALRESEARFRSIFEGVGSGMALVDVEGTILVINPALAAMLGYEPDELTGMTTAAITHPEDNTSSQNELRRRLWSEEIDRYQLEKRYLRKDGSTMWGLLSTTPIRDERGEISAALGQILDITARKATEEALRESEVRFHTAFEHAPIGLALVSPDGRFQQVNRSLCDLVGYSEAELVNKTFQEITHPEDLTDDLDQATRLWAGEIDTYGMEKRYIHKNGHAVWTQLSVSAVQDDRDSRYAIAQIEDISGRRHLDLERATMLASEREYTRQLRELADMRADLTAMVAHDLRSPVAAVRVMTEMLATGELAPDAAAQTFASMLAQIDQMHRLVSDVAASAASERDDFSVQLQPVALSVLLEGAEVFARTALSDRDFHVVAAPDVQVWCDPERISQVLSNLLGNAAKHTPPNTRVVLGAEMEDRHVRLSVTNQGAPIPAHELGLIFEKFARGRDATERNAVGVGLGLYLSRRIVETHGSELSVASSAEHGTTFGFELRVAS